MITGETKLHLAHEWHNGHSRDVSGRMSNIQGTAAARLAAYYKSRGWHVAFEDDALGARFEAWTPPYADGEVEVYRVYYPEPDQLAKFKRDA